MSADQKATFARLCRKAAEREAIKVLAPSVYATKHVRAFS